MNKNEGDERDAIAEMFSEGFDSNPAVLLAEKSFDEILAPFCRNVE